MIKLIFLNLILVEQLIEKYIVCRGLGIDTFLS